MSAKGRPGGMTEGQLQAINDSFGSDEMICDEDISAIGVLANMNKKVNSNANVEVAIPPKNANGSAPKKQTKSVQSQAQYQANLDFFNKNVQHQYLRSDTRVGGGTGTHFHPAVHLVAHPASQLYPAAQFGGGNNSVQFGGGCNNSAQFEAQFGGGVNSAQFGGGGINSAHFGGGGINSAQFGGGVNSTAQFGAGGDLFGSQVPNLYNATYGAVGSYMHNQHTGLPEVLSRYNQIPNRAAKLSDLNKRLDSYDKSALQQRSQQLQMHQQQLQQQQQHHLQQQQHHHHQQQQQHHLQQQQLQYQQQQHMSPFSLQNSGIGMGMSASNSLLNRGMGMGLSSSNSFQNNGIGSSDSNGLHNSGIVIGMSSSNSFHSSGVGTGLSSSNSFQNNRIGSSDSNSLQNTGIRMGSSASKSHQNNGVGMGLSISNSNIMSANDESSNITNISSIDANMMRSDNSFHQNLQPSMRSSNGLYSSLSSISAESSAFVSELAPPPASATSQSTREDSADDWDDDENESMEIHTSESVTALSGGSMSGRTDDEDFSPLISDTNSNSNSSNSNSNSNFGGTKSTPSEITRRHSKRLKIKGVQIVYQNKIGEPFSSTKGYRIQLTTKTSSTKKITKNLDDYNEALMFYEIALLSTDNITHLSTLLDHGNFYCLQEKGLVEDAREFYIVLGRYIFLFEKLRKMKSDFGLYLNAYNNLVVDVDFQTSFLSSGTAPSSPLPPPPPPALSASLGSQIQLPMSSLPMHPMHPAQSWAVNQQDLSFNHMLAYDDRSMGMPNIAATFVKDRFMSKFYEAPLVLPTKGLSLSSLKMNAKDIFDDLSAVFMVSYKSNKSAKWDALQHSMY